MQESNIDNLSGWQAPPQNSPAYYADRPVRRCPYRGQFQINQHAKRRNPDCIKRSYQCTEAGKAPFSKGPGKVEIFDLFFGDIG
jgi:hypothetical protein